MRLKHIIPSLRLISIQNIMFCLLWLLLTFSIVWFRPNITSLVVYFLLLKKSMFQVESSSFLGQLKEFFWYLVAPSSVYFHSTHLLDLSLSLSLSLSLCLRKLIFLLMSVCWSITPFYYNEHILLIVSFLVISEENTLLADCTHFLKFYS